MNVSQCFHSRNNPGINTFYCKSNTYWKSEPECLEKKLSLNFWFVECPSFTPFLKAYVFRDVYANFSPHRAEMPQAS